MLGICGQPLLERLFAGGVDTSAVSSREPL
jgi:hypothetical protein